MARREGRPARREDTARNGRKAKSGMFTGLVLGVALGIAAAAALAWYFNMGSQGLKAEPASPAPFAENPSKKSPTAELQTLATETLKPPAASVARAADKTAQVVAPAKAPTATPPAAPPTAQTKPAVTKTSAPSARQPFPYTFYGILPGDKPARPIEAPAAKEAWWLQIAALSNRQKAEQIRARLVLLNLRASTQTIDNNGQPLYRIRVGPYKEETDAFGDLDILTQNELNARLLKDPLNPK